MRSSSVVIGILLLLAATAVLIFLRAPRSAGRLIGDTTSITFRERGFEQLEKSFAVTDQADVQRIVGSIRLRRKDPCPCAHLHEATFQKPEGNVRVSFCDRCFDVLAGQTSASHEGATLYEMPKEFYAEFRRLVHSRTNEEWHVRP